MFQNLDGEGFVLLIAHCSLLVFGLNCIRNHFVGVMRSQC